VSAPDDALAQLLAGNERFATGRESGAGRDAARRLETAEAQSPATLVLTCSDSRVSPELVFDQGIGDVLVVRIAGNDASSPAVSASIEFFVTLLDLALIVVLGHERCGALGAVLDAEHGRTSLPPSFAAVSDALVAAARAVAHLPGETRLAAAVDRNIRDQVALVEGLEVVAGARAAGTLEVVGARYELGSGRVRLLDG
jgi:carbonic anhydrase